MAGDQRTENMSLKVQRGRKNKKSQGRTKEERKTSRRMTRHTFVSSVSSLFPGHAELSPAVSSPASPSHPSPRA